MDGGGDQQGQLVLGGDIKCFDRSTGPQREIHELYYIAGMFVVVVRVIEVGFSYFLGEVAAGDLL